MHLRTRKNWSIQCCSYNKYLYFGGVLWENIHLDLAGMYKKKKWYDNELHAQIITGYRFGAQLIVEEKYCMDDETQIFKSIYVYCLLSKREIFSEF